ncbi:cobalt/nickel transport system permease protein [Geodermatophilus saharensis]|uniref:Cobalt/nickel transport system permease protein n=1 Tax=Geodermatophilus saharensis TaxID=1137994 RepID=A0A239AHB9_9ACTN|nr:cobalt ECF transporter T component CbiQ [Geodermatophilus saharensis]SNR94434.1 cobalt/nickel transport system permease protein [Geodermatophilus saharensis]
MGAGHGGPLGAAYVARDTAVHRLPAHVSLVAVLAFALVVVATPLDPAWAPAYGGYAVLVLAAAALARVPAARLARGLVVELPFVLFALLLPVVARGPRVEVLGLSLSESGLVTAGGLLAKATLSVLAATVLAATTTPQDLVRGLQRLRLPAVLVQILSFMVRYADVVTGELRRMRVARESRGFRGRGPGALRVVAATAGALFVRSYERGERVHLAMLARGGDGRLPAGPAPAVPVGTWLTGLALPLSAGAVLAAGVLGA